jgi:hypothetical protein
MTGAESGTMLLLGIALVALGGCNPRPVQSCIAYAAIAGPALLQIECPPPGWYLREPNHVESVTSE